MENENTITPQWELVTSTDPYVKDGAWGLGEQTTRLKVPGGFLYKTIISHPGTGQVSTDMCYVPLTVDGLDLFKSKP